MSEKHCNFAKDHEGTTDELLEKLVQNNKNESTVNRLEAMLLQKLTFAAVTVVFFLGCCAELFLLLGLLFSLVELFFNKHSLP